MFIKKNNECIEVNNRINVRCVFVVVNVFWCFCCFLVAFFFVAFLSILSSCLFIINLCYSEKKEKKG